MNYHLNILPSGEIHICPPNYSLPVGVCVFVCWGESLLDS